MKNQLLIFSFLSALFYISGSDSLNGQANDSNPVITKENGRIIKGYLAFGNFLKSDGSWISYKKLVLDAYPEMQAVHNKQISWGSIDSAKFPGEVNNYKKDEWGKYFSRYDDPTLNFLYDSVISKANKILKPISSNPVDLFLYLPYGGCFILSDKARSTIYISLLIDPADAEKIMVHEYAHNLHIQRHQMEAFNLRREIVAEGIAVYLTTLVMKDAGIANSIPFMPLQSVKWCFDNEKAIRDSIGRDLEDSTFTGLKKYIADGPVSTPPKGFVEKTGYFAGYRIIEACIKKGMTLEEVCSSDSHDLIARSGYFE